VVGAIVLVALIGGGIAVIATRDTESDTARGGRAGGETAETNPTTSPTTNPETTTTTNPTTTTTTTTSLPPDPNAVALSDLAETIDVDRPSVDSHLGRWVPQISAKRDGLRWEGIEYGFPQIRDLHRELDDRYGAILVSGAEYNFRLDDQPMTGWFISIVDQSFVAADGALDWCRQNDIDRDNCAAKLITNDQNIDGTLVLQ
jgi:serine/threonine-protein kinase